MPARPNILVLMCDQLQGRVFEPGHPCRTPNFDRLAARGVRVTRAYAPNPICSPSRASMMTGLLPHNHGVLWVTNSVPADRACLREEHPHWAQRLTQAGYRTGYFGKWHVEHSEQPARFGWQVDRSFTSPGFRDYEQAHGSNCLDNLQQAYYVDGPEGYRKGLLYGVTSTPAKRRAMGLVIDLAEAYLDDVAGTSERPWCCFVSTAEPHDPFICGEEAFTQYDPESLPIPANWCDPMADRPAIYRRLARGLSSVTEQHKRRAMACYYASITELDQQFGRLLDRLEASGQAENTVVMLVSDHGEFLGAHGLYCKNISAFEEAYHIPMIAAGPGIAPGQSADARVGLHEVYPTLLELAGIEHQDKLDGRSFAPLLAHPVDEASRYGEGYAESYGARFELCQRVCWDGPWKFVFNAFDDDELYDLDADPGELTNLAGEPAQRGRCRAMTAQLWSHAKRTGDARLLQCHYLGVRIGAWGPNIA